MIWHLWHLIVTFWLPFWHIRLNWDQMIETHRVWLSKWKYCISKDNSQFSTECNGPVEDSIQVQILLCLERSGHTWVGEVEGEARHTRKLSVRWQRIHMVSCKSRCNLWLLLEPLCRFIFEQTLGFKLWCFENFDMLWKMWRVVRWCRNVSRLRYCFIPFSDVSKTSQWTWKAWRYVESLNCYNVFQEGFCIICCKVDRRWNKRLVDMNNLQHYIWWCSYHWFHLKTCGGVQGIHQRVHFNFEIWICIICVI